MKNEDVYFEKMWERDCRINNVGGYDAPDNQEPQVVLCDYCDNFNPVNARYCSKCGERLGGCCG